MRDQPPDDLGETIRDLRAKARAARGIFPPPPPPRLRIVTAENAHEFMPAQKKRGRPRKVKPANNVVPLKSTGSAESTKATDQLSPEFAAWFGSFIDRINALPIGARSNKDET